VAEAILVLVRHPTEIELLLDAAACLAEIMGGARINALAIRETVEISPAVAATLADRTQALVAARANELQRVLNLEDLFGNWAAAPGKRAENAHWFGAEGVTADIVGEWGRRADVIVMAQPSQDDRLGRQALRMGLFGTDRPILMVPSGPALPGNHLVFGRCIAIAWRDEKQALRAVLPALRWLAGAQQVHVLVGVRDTKISPGVPSVLLERGLTATLHVLPIRPGPVGQTLLSAAHDLQADLLIMGAYAHSPIRELVMGGVTRYMLAHADLPVLMRH
jgi:nucleotide-binding universal stress UspA family protein